jgi:ribonuclease M5
MKVKELIVVEGKTDLIFLKSFLDADIVITNGSEVSHETLEFIKEANKRQGVIILTDPDYPGLRIRNIVSEYIGECKHAYIEKKKAIKGKKVGVAETKKEYIIAALNNVVTYSNVNSKNITEVDLYEMGLFGKCDSKFKRDQVCDKYHLGWCNAKTFLKRINMFGLSIDDIKEVIKDDYS